MLPLSLAELKLTDSTAMAASRIELPMTEVAKGVFVHNGRHETFTPENQGDISNLGFIIGDDAVAVVDTSGSFAVGQALRDQIKARTDRPIRYVINTHMHPDHVFGNAAFMDTKATFVAHHKMERGLRSRADRYVTLALEALGKEAFSGTEIVYPTLPIEQATSLDLGNREILLVPRQTAHTDNDITILDTSTKSLFTGDLIF
ncbi:MAG: MBL fold metallo-hydrolase, partial [Pseudomonadota bacterium]